MSNTVEGRDGLLLTIDNVPSNQNPRCTLFRLSYQPMKMAALGTRLSLATTCNLLSAFAFLYLVLAPTQPSPLPSMRRSTITAGAAHRRAANIATARGWCQWVERRRQQDWPFWR